MVYINLKVLNSHRYHCKQEGLYNYFNKEYFNILRECRQGQLNNYHIIFNYNYLNLKEMNNHRYLCKQEWLYNYFDKEFFNIFRECRQG